MRPVSGAPKSTMPFSSIAERQAGEPPTSKTRRVGIVGPGAGELIAEGVLAVETATLAEDVATTIHAHPTLSETLMESAEQLLG